MKTGMLLVGGLGLSLLGTGCASHKYVQRTVAPVTERVSNVENKNNEQDKQLSSQGSQIENVDRDLSRTKERLTDTDNKAAAAGEAARTADSKAVAAQGAADGAKNLAQQGVDRATQVSSKLDRTVSSLYRMKVAKEGTIQFGFAKRTLDDEAKAQLDDFAKSFQGVDGFVVEIQGFTDKTGPADYNRALSQDRAEAVARYLIDQHKVPLRAINFLGIGESPEEQKTRDERAAARRVEYRVYLPELVSGNNTSASNN